MVNQPLIFMVNKVPTFVVNEASRDEVDALFAFTVNPGLKRCRATLTLYN